MRTSALLLGPTRRHFLQVGAAGLVTSAVVGGALLPTGGAGAAPYRGSHTWMSPRGTLEVMDDYPYWVAREMGYFGDLGVATKMDAGPSDGTAVVKALAVHHADIGFLSPGVLSFAINNEMDLVSVYGSGALDLFDIAFRKGEGRKDLSKRASKTVLLGSAAWQSIADPMFAAGSPRPSNSLVVRRADILNPDRKAFLQKYLKGWAMASEFADRNPRAAAQIVFNALPQTRQAYGPRHGTESLLQVHRTFQSKLTREKGWGYHDLPAWDHFFEVLRSTGQSSSDIDARKYVLNDFIADANRFDRAKVHADADNFVLESAMKAVDMAGMEKSFHFGVINELRPGNPVQEP